MNGVFDDIDVILENYDLEFNFGEGVESDIIEEEDDFGSNVVNLIDLVEEKDF